MLVVLPQSRTCHAQMGLNPLNLRLDDAIVLNTINISAHFPSTVNEPLEVDAKVTHVRSISSHCISVYQSLRFVNDGSSGRQFARVSRYCHLVLNVLIEDCAILECIPISFCCL